MGQKDETLTLSELSVKDSEIVNPELLALMIRLLGDAGTRSMICNLVIVSIAELCFQETDWKEFRMQMLVLQLHFRSLL